MSQRGSQPALSQPALESVTAIGPAAAPRSSEGNLATSMLKILRPGRPAEAPAGSIKIGRNTDNDIVIPDVLASRHHATLIPGPSGTEIRDNRSINGTFVNGSRVESAVLHEGDTVTIGNVDLVFRGGALVRRTETTAASGTGGLDVHGVTWTIEGNKTLLDDISLTARPGTLTAVIGPSGAGKSTFARLVAGYTHPTTGTVAFEGHDVHAEYASLRSRIGMVPQDDVVHGQLTVNQALMFAAELRLPPDTNKEDRERVVAQVLEELEMTQHRRNPRGQAVRRTAQARIRRDGAADRSVAADPGRADVGPRPRAGPAGHDDVAPARRRGPRGARGHSLVVLPRRLRSGIAAGPRRQDRVLRSTQRIGPAMGTTNWADIFSSVARDPDAADQRFIATHGPTPPRPPAQTPADLGKPTKTSLRKQFSTISRRQMRLIISDRGYFIFLAVLPFIMGVLSLSVPGDVGFGVPVPAIKGGEAPNEPGQILVLLNVGAIFMGTALTIRALIGERAIFLREQAVGLSTTAYLLAKVVVFAAFAVLQSAIVVAINIYGKKWGPGAVESGAVIPNRTLELFVDMAACCVAAAMVGLALSALAKSNEQIMPLLVIAIMSQLVFQGGMIPVTGRIGLDQLSWITPARWGFASTASTIDLLRLVPGPLTPQDSHWKHTPGAWWFNMAMLGCICIGYLSFVRWKIRLKAG